MSARFLKRSLHSLLLSLFILTKPAYATLAFDYVDTVMDSLQHVQNAAKLLGAIPSEEMSIGEENQWAMENVQTASVFLQQAREEIVSFAQEVRQTKQKNRSVKTSIIAFDRGLSKLMDNLEGGSKLMKTHLHDVSRGDNNIFASHAEEFITPRKDRWLLIWSAMKLATYAMLEARAVNEGEASNFVLEETGEEWNVRRAITEEESQILLRKFESSFGKRSFSDGIQNQNGFDFSLRILWEALNREWDSLSAEGQSDARLAEDAQNQFNLVNPGFDFGSSYLNFSFQFLYEDHQAKPELWLHYGGFLSPDEFKSWNFEVHEDWEEIDHFIIDQSIALRSGSRYGSGARATFLIHEARIVPVISYDVSQSMGFRSSAKSQNDGALNDTEKNFGMDARFTWEAFDELRLNAPSIRGASGEAATSKLPVGSTAAEIESRLASINNLPVVGKIFKDQSGTSQSSEAIFLVKPQMMARSEE